MPKGKLPVEAEPVPAGKAETSEQTSEEPGATLAQPKQAAMATPRPGQVMPVVEPPERAPMPGAGSTDGVTTSNPDTPVIEEAPELSAEEQNVSLRAELERLQRVSGALDGTNGKPCPDGFPKLVTATQMCFYNDQRYREGDTFGIRQPEDFAKKSMVWAARGTPQRQTTGGQHLKQVHDEVLGARMEKTTGSENVIGA